MTKDKSWFRKHWFLTGFGAIIILIIVISATSGGSNTTNPETQQVAIEITAVELFKAYNRNEIAADNKYEGKLLKVNGTIVDFGKDIFDNPYIQFISQYSGGVICNAKESELQKMGTLNKGDFITVQGIGDGYLIDADIKNCIILD